MIIPIHPYNRFVAACPESSAQYSLLKNGLIIADPRYGTSIEILCDLQEAKQLLGLASVVCPDAAPYIGESIRLARQP